MNEHDIFGIIAFIILCLGTATIVIIRKKMADKELAKKRASYPTTWVHIGEVPKGADIALKVIKEELPLWTGRYGGTIEWVKGPFYLDFVLAAGGVLEFEEPRIKLMYNDDITKTAIAHEVFHVYQMWYGGNKILDGDPALYLWVASTNNKIRAAMA